MGVLRAIARREKSRAPMEEIPVAELTKAAGIEGDLRGRPGRRQVTILALEAWRAAEAELSKTLPWTFRRANLLVEGIGSIADTVGRRLKIGDAVVEITGETDPCRRMEEQHPGLQAALMPDWRGGVTARVIQDGRISVGSPVVWL